MMCHVFSAILQGIAAAIYNQLFIEKKPFKIDKNIRLIMRCFKARWKDMSIYQVCEDIYVVYIEKTGYLFNIKTKAKYLCDPNEKLIKEYLKMIYLS